MRRMFFLKYYTICTCTVQFIDCFSTVKKMRRMREGAQVREYCPPPYYVVIYFLFFFALMNIYYCKSDQLTDLKIQLFCNQ